MYHYTPFGMVSGSTLIITASSIAATIGLSPDEDGDEPIKKDLQAVKVTQQQQGEDIKTIKTVQQEQGKKIDTLLSGQAHIETVLETLDEKIDETKTEVDEIKQRQRPRHVD